jgi:hypothetical protein
MHGASKHLWAKPFRTKVVPLIIITAPTAWIFCVLLGLFINVPWRDC